MQVLNDLKMPNKETLYFNDHIVPWIEKEEWANNEHTEVALTFKKNTPVDIINKFVNCNIKLDTSCSLIDVV